MPEPKITKEQFLARRAAAAHAHLAVANHMQRHPWMTLEQVEEDSRINALSEAEQEAHYAAVDKKQLKNNLLMVEGVDDDLAERLTQGGVVYFHTIASALPYQQFHDLAHRMIGSPAAGC